MGGREAVCTCVCETTWWGPGETPPECRWRTVGGEREEGRQDGLGVSGEERGAGGGSSDGDGSQADADACIQGPRVSSSLRKRLLCRRVWDLRGGADESVHKTETRTQDTDPQGPKGRVRAVIT